MPRVTIVAAGSLPLAFRGPRRRLVSFFIDNMRARRAHVAVTQSSCSESRQTFGGTEARIVTRTYRNSGEFRYECGFATLGLSPHTQ